MSESEAASRTEQELSIAQLAAEIKKLRENQKEQQPNFLAAIKVLADDLEAWRQGERDYPKAAMLGVIFAYLRPRILVVVGSVFAVTLGAMQVWMLYRQNALITQQNELVGQQNGLISGQSYALRAQSTAALLADVGDDNPASSTRLALLSTFGDIGIDSLIVLARSKSSAGEAARATLSSLIRQLGENQNRISAEQTFQVLKVFLEYRLLDYVSRVPGPTYDYDLRSADRKNREQLERITQRKVAEFAFDGSRFERLSPERLLDPYLLNEPSHYLEINGHLALWSEKQRAEIMKRMTLLFVFYLTYPSNEDDHSLARICRAMYGQSTAEYLSLYEKSIEEFQVIRRLKLDVTALTAVTHVLSKTCGEFAEGYAGSSTFWIDFVPTKEFYDGLLLLRSTAELN